MVSKFVFSLLLMITSGGSEVKQEQSIHVRVDESGVFMSENGGKERRVEDNGLRKELYEEGDFCDTKCETEVNGTDVEYEIKKRGSKITISVKTKVEI